MICFPNAKINLGLNIVSKRADGYHNLETIFYPIPIKDALEILPKEDLIEDVFVEAGIEVDASPENNLVMRALRLIRTKYDFPYLEVHLLKKIPFGAGLGGGSADASFMLRLINDSFDLGATKQELAALAVQLGADCPFFIYNQPVFASGIGEVFEEVSISLKGYYFILVKPDIHIPTKDAFAQIVPTKPTVSLMEIIKAPITEWKGVMVNDFEKSIFPNYPAIATIKETLYENGALYASMSGSGSSVFGIFEKEVHLHHLFGNHFYWEGFL